MPEELEGKQVLLRCNLENNQEVCFFSHDRDAENGWVTTLHNIVGEWHWKRTKKDGGFDLVPLEPGMFFEIS